MSRMPPVDPFTEHVSVMQALYQQYQKPEDFENLITITAVIHDMRAQSATHDVAVKEIIRGLTSDVKQLEVKSQYPYPPDQHQQKTAALECDIKTAKDSISHLLDNTREAQVERQHLADRTVQAGVLVEELKQPGGEEEKLKKRVGLFRLISNINFRPEIKDRVSGAVSDSAKGEIRPFDLDPHRISHFEMVNKLWQLIDR